MPGQRLPRLVIWTAAGIFLVAAAGTCWYLCSARSPVLRQLTPASSSAPAQPLARATVLSGSAEDIAARTAALLFAAAPAAVVADGSKPH